MQTVRKILRKCWEIFSKGEKGKFRLLRLNEAPDRPEKDVLYVIGENGFVWHFVMKCPCGCGSTIFLNAQKGEFPSWSLSEKNGFFSLSPSINRLVGCRSHFFLRNGDIVWAVDTDSF